MAMPPPRMMKRMRMLMGIWARLSEHQWAMIHQASVDHDRDCRFDLIGIDHKTADTLLFMLEDHIHRMVRAVHEGDV